MAEDIDVSLAKNGNTDAFGRLLSSYYPLIVALATRFHSEGLSAGIGVEDLMQEASIAFYNAVKTYEVGKHTTFGLYAKICMKNAIVSFVRKNSDSLHTALDEAMQKDESTTDGEPLGWLISVEQTEDLKIKIRSLLTEYEYKVLICHVCGKSASATAKELGVSEKSVYNAIARAKTKLKSLI